MPNFSTTRTEIATIPVAELAQRFGTPTFVYDAAQIVRRLEDLAAFDHVRYAQKACSNLAIVDLVRRHGALVDAVSANEVRRALAETSGRVLEPGEDPGPVDFSNPDSQQRLAALFVDRYGQGAYEELRVEMAPPVKSGKSKQAPEDPGELAKLLFSDLIKRETVDPNLLKQLADDRAQAIVRQITGPDGIPPERIIIKPSEGTDAGEPVSSVLGLDAMAPNS